MKENLREQDYFSLQNLDNLSGIDEHLAFVNTLVEKYCNQALVLRKDLDIWRAIQLNLWYIRRKRNDKRLNIGVIGEFSTGKSTFINALLRQELLASSKLQGTTVASTVISYGKQYCIQLQYMNLKQRSIVYPDFASLKKDLDKFTTETSVARQLKKVNVFLPADILKNDFCIIDTPGTNVTEAWHEDVTIRALKEESDLSIILISAERPASETLLRFVNQNLESILPQCVFVVTYLDQIRPRERKRQLAYIKMKLEEELEIQNAVVLPYVSPMVLHNNTDESITYKTEDEELLSLSYETEGVLVEHTARQRTIAITKKIMGLIDEIYQSIHTNLETLSRTYEENLAILERSRKVDLESFIGREKKERQIHFDKYMKQQEEKIQLSVYSDGEAACDKILGNLDSKQSIDNIKDYINSSLGKDCSAVAMEMISDMDEYYRKVQIQFKYEMQKFNKAFSGMYEVLDIIPVDMSKSRYKLPAQVTIETANISSAANYIAQQLSSENKAFFGGAAAGAAIGTALLPGVGTVLGAFGGLMAGAFMAPDTNEVRNECKEKLKPQLKNYYNGVADKIISGIEQYTVQIRKCLSTEIDSYIARYHRDVEHMIELENRKRNEINTKVMNLKKDINQMTNHKKALESVAAQLNHLGRKDR